MQTLAIRAADAIVLVYSVDNRDSFEHLESLRDKVLAEKEEDEVTLYVLANKADLSPYRQVSFSEAELKIKIGWDTSFGEVSAKTGDGLEGKLSDIVPPTFLTGITPEVSTKRNSGGPELGSNPSGGMAKRKSITEALSKPFSLMNRGSTSRRRGTTAAAENLISKLPETVEQSAAVTAAATAVSSSNIGVKKTNTSRLSIGWHSRPITFRLEWSNQPMISAELLGPNFCPKFLYDKGA